MGAHWPRSRTKNKDEILNGAAERSGQGSEQTQKVDEETASEAGHGIPSLRAFAYDEKAVRAVEREGQVWFVAQDVCDVLGLSNSSQALKKLDESEKGVTETDTPGGVQTMAIINESGALCLILRSRKPEARVFRRWVTGVVLPAILRTGNYSGPSQEGAASPHITLPGPGSYIAHVTAAGQVTCLPASEEEAAVRIYFAEGSLMCHTLKSIRAHWSIVQHSRVFEDGPRSSLGEEGLGRAIAEGDRLATAFLPLWDLSTRGQA